VLVFFIRHQGRLVEKSELLDAVWHDSFVTPNALTRVIAQLRKSLGDDAKEARYIETVPTRGYRFIAAVKAVEVVKDKSEATGQEPAQAHPEMPLEQAFLAGRAARHRHSWKMPGVAGLLLLLASFIFFFKPGPDSDGNWISVRRTTQITAAPLIDMYPAFSPDGETLAYCTVREGSFEIFVRPLTPGSKELQVTTDGGQNMQPTW
jgi:DNA-binding winged helix-turn-helix (wHTH) protein